MKVYIPFYKSPPNKFLRYEIQDFNDGHGNGGKVKIAYFINKRGKEESVDAQVMWEYGWPSNNKEYHYWLKKD